MLTYDSGKGVKTVPVGQKELYQAGAAFATGVVSEYSKRAATAAVGTIMAVALGVLGYLLAPTARGTMVPVAAGLMDGAASWLGANIAAPMLRTKTAGLFGAAGYVPPARVYTPSYSSPSVGVSALEI